VSLERQDVRAKLDPDMHEALVAICDAKGLTVGEFIEGLLVPEIKRLLHEAHCIASRTRGPGTTGKNREQPGIDGRGRAKRPEF
jgi:hypothetical protein